MSDILISRKRILKYLNLKLVKIVIFEIYNKYKINKNWRRKKSFFGLKVRRPIQFLLDVSPTRVVGLVRRDFVHKSIFRWFVGFYSFPLIFSITNITSMIIGFTPKYLLGSPFSIMISFVYSNLIILYFKWMSFYSPIISWF